MFDIAIPFPPISPIAFEIPQFALFGFEIGPLALRWYALGYIAGILIAWNILNKLGKDGKIWGKDKAPFNPDIIDDFIFFAIIGILFGGRIGYTFFYAPEMLLNPISILKTWEGGMSFHGGIIGVILAVLWVNHKYKIGLFHLADAVALSAPLGIGIVRVTNFVNQELWGRSTNVPWAFIFDTDPLSIPRHPSQLYEAFFEGFLLFAIIFIAIKFFGALKKQGLAASIFLIGYSLSRIGLENFREPDAELIFGLTRGMFYSIPLLIMGIAILYASLRPKNQ